MNMQLTIIMRPFKFSEREKPDPEYKHVVTLGKSEGLSTNMCLRLISYRYKYWY